MKQDLETIQIYLEQYLNKLNRIWKLFKFIN